MVSADETNSTLEVRAANKFERERRLEDAGWSATGIVTLSQLVAFLAFQLRVVAGLTALQATRAASVTEGAGR